MRRTTPRKLPVFTCLLIIFPMLPWWSGLEVFAQNRPVSEANAGILRTKIKEVAQSTQTISSDFTQEKEMGMVREKIISKGKFYFKREKMLRWEYMQPYAYLIIIRNDQISIRDDNKVNQFNLQSNRVFQEINRIITGSIRGTLLEDEKNFMASFSENLSSWVVTLKTLTPKLKESLTEIVIFFDRKDYSVTRLEMYEPGGDCTRINFTGRKLNQPIDDEKFLIH